MSRSSQSEVVPQRGMGAPGSRCHEACGTHTTHATHTTTPRAGDDRLAMFRQQSALVSKKLAQVCGAGVVVAKVAAVLQLSGVAASGPCD